MDGSRAQDERAGLFLSSWISQRFVTASSLWQMFGQVKDVYIVLRAAAGGAVVDVVGLHDVPIPYVDELIRSFALPEHQHRHAAAAGGRRGVRTSHIVQVYTLSIEFVSCANRRCGKLQSDFFESLDPYWKIHGVVRYYELDLSDLSEGAAAQRRSMVFPPRPCFVADSAPAPPLAVHRIEGPSNFEYEQHYLPLGSFVLDTVGGMRGIREEEQQEEEGEEEEEDPTTARRRTTTVDMSDRANQLLATGAPSCAAYFAWHSFHFSITGRTGMRDRWPDRGHTPLPGTTGHADDGEGEGGEGGEGLAAVDPGWVTDMWYWYAGTLRPRGPRLGMPCSTDAECWMPDPPPNATLPAGSAQFTMACASTAGRAEGRLKGRVCQVPKNTVVPVRRLGDLALLPCAKIEPPCPAWCVQRAQSCVTFPSYTYGEDAKQLLHANAPANDTMAQSEAEEEGTHSEEGGELEDRGEEGEGRREEEEGDEEEGMRED
jgi:hypothetical protein